MLTAKNLRTLRPKKKFASKFVGPFKVEELIGRQAYRVALPPRIGSVHLVFYVSMLEPYYRSDDVAPLAEEVDSEDQ